MSITLGSLFDGIGGFPLAALRLGITPIWASEIEPFPLRVTALRFPEMAQLGDITRLNGADVPPVDIVTGGSPCQDLSIAGARAGLAGERSGLFLEQIRLIREMREVDQHRQRPTEFIRPRFMVWENVPGTFSSAEGEDFRIVLEETVRIAAPACSVPRPPNGKWHPAGAVMGDGFSLAWRTLDAQYWGVPQRRARIFLVADFGGTTAPQILFEPAGLPGHPPPGGETGQAPAVQAGVGRCKYRRVSYSFPHQSAGRSDRHGKYHRCAHGRPKYADADFCGVLCGGGRRGSGRHQLFRRSFPYAESLAIREYGSLCAVSLRPRRPGDGIGRRMSQPPSAPRSTATSPRYCCSTTTARLPL